MLGIKLTTYLLTDTHARARTHTYTRTYTCPCTYSNYSSQYVCRVEILLFCRAGEFVVQKLHTTHLQLTYKFESCENKKIKENK